MVLPTITVDIGTTSVKLSLFDSDAAPVASLRVTTPTTRDDTGEIYDITALRAVITDFIAGLGSAIRATVERIAITGVGESGGLVAPDLTLASPMILWHDQRGQGRLAGLSAEDRTRIYEVTGLPVSGNYAISKAAWAIDSAPSSTIGTKWLNVAEYVAALMTGERWSEPSLASRTMALHLTRGEWSEEVCELFGIDTAVFPALRPASHGTPIAPRYAAEVGLPADVHVHVAGHDHMVGGVGADLQPGELLNSTGTTEGLLFLADSPDLGPRAERAKLANGLDCRGHGYTLFASIPTGGSAFETLQHLIGIDANELNRHVRRLHAKYLAGAIHPDAAPLVLPRFRGAPPPTKDTRARGLIAGLRTDSTVEELVLGCFLGMVLQFRDVLELFESPTQLIKVIGPASRNPLWQQLKADLLGVPLSASQVSEVVSLGAQALVTRTTRRWSASDPHEIVVDPDRHHQLTAWADTIRPQWEYLKGFPS